MTYASIALYCLAASCQWLIVFQRLNTKPYAATALGAGASAVALHAYLLLDQLFISEGLNLSFFNATSLVAWFIATLGLLAALRHPIQMLYIVLFPLAALSLWANAVSSHDQNILSNISAGISSHIISSILAYSILTLAAIQAGVLRLQEYQLKHRHLSGILQMMPPLQTMERVLFELIWVGLLLLSIAIGSGAIYLEDIFAQHLVHKTVLSIMAWIIFAILLWGRHQKGWRSQTAIHWTLGGFVVLMLGYFGSKLVLELILDKI
jgi:ABC-type uncharacterized transport system permease subunit